MEKQKLNTHLKFQKKFGQLIEISHDSAKVRLETTKEMAVDEEGLVHGGFTFGAADFCAMATVNDPFVVLVRSQCEFMAPVKVGDTVDFISETLMKEKRKHEIKVTGYLNEIKVFEGIFSCVKLDRHILKRK
ncbi:hotdog domain-containing protein [Nautilia sp.]